MMAATREDPVVVSDSSDVLSDTENGEWLELTCSAGVFWVGKNLVRVHNIVVAAIFDFMTVEDWGE